MSELSAATSNGAASQGLSRRAQSGNGGGDSATAALLASAADGEAAAAAPSDPRRNSGSTNTHININSTDDDDASSDDGAAKERRGGRVRTWWRTRRRRVPYKAIALAVVLFVAGSTLLGIGVYQMRHTPVPDEALPLLILGSLLFIPGAYHTRIALWAYFGYAGFDMSDIPEFDWE